jgi:tRNA wybutosine-synthesizing protein 5
MGSFLNPGLLSLEIDAVLGLEKKLTSPLHWIRNSSSIPRFRYNELDAQNLAWLRNQRKPFILTDVPMGVCRQRWKSKAYLQTVLPPETSVSVHVCPNHALGFAGGKNYAYKVMSWQTFLDGVFTADGEQPSCYYYLRSIGSNPRKEPSHLASTFPQMADDISLPSLLASFIASTTNEEGSLADQWVFMEDKDFKSCFLGMDAYFSSILRISTPGLHLWTHYDVMDNFLMQPLGSKFITLFSPKNISHLNVPPGAHNR